MNDITDRHLIKKFLRNELSNEEAMHFKTRKEDIQFIEALENEIILVKNRSLLKERLQEISTAPSSNKKQKSKFVYIAIAASIALLITLQLFNNRSLSSQEVYNSFYETYPNVYNQKGTKGSSVSNFQKAMQFYNAKDYTSAKNTFEAISKTNDLKDNELFYYGITLMEINEHHVSEKQFRLIKNTNSPYYIEAQWYLALSLIKENKKQVAKTILETILESNSIGQKRKKEVIQLLDKI